MTKVGIFVAGYSDLRPADVIRLLSVKDAEYYFEVGARIHTMGDPDLDGVAYSDKAFLAVVEQYRQQFDVCVILTSVPICANFFTITIDQDTVISTSFQADELLRKSGRSLAEYYALAVCQELVSFAFQRASGLPWAKLFHKENRGCLFDFAEHKPEKIRKLTNCDICPQSAGLLAQHNVDDRTVSFVKRILRRIRRPSLRKALRQCVDSPVLSFLFGGVVIGFSVSVFASLVLNTAALSTQQVRVIWVMGGCIPAFPIAVYAVSWVSYLRKRFEDVNA